MAKTIYICQECGASALRWSGKCSECQNWNTLVEELKETRKSTSRRNRSAVRPVGLGDVPTEARGGRIDTKIAELDQVLGGGVVPGSLVLIAGEPGVGKSTLILQMSAHIAESQAVLYVSGEESMQQIKLRAERLGIKNSEMELASTTDIDSVIATIEDNEYGFVVVDSIQTMQTDDLQSNAGTISQITNSTQRLQEAAKRSGSAVLLVGHVTKEGNIAGPKVLEHLVDVVLHLEGERFGSFKLLRGIKNRYGSTHEVGIFEMQETGMQPVENPSKRFLDERQAGDGSAVFATIEGTRALLVEVQALVSTSPFGYPKRTAVGFDLNRLNLLIAVLSRRAGVNLADKDVYVNIVGGMKLAEPAADLAVALAIASSAKKRPIKQDAVIFGEVGLSGEVRSVSDVQKRIKEAKKLRFKRALGPTSDQSYIESIKSLREAINQGLTRS